MISPFEYFLLKQIYTTKIADKLGTVPRSLVDVVFVLHHNHPFRVGNPVARDEVVQQGLKGSGRSRFGVVLPVVHVCFALLVAVLVRPYHAVERDNEDVVGRSSNSYQSGGRGRRCLVTTATSAVERDDASSLGGSVPSTACRS